MLYIIMIILLNDCIVLLIRLGRVAPSWFYDIGKNIHHSVPNQKK